MELKSQMNFLFLVLKTRAFTLELALASQAVFEWKILISREIEGLASSSLPAFYYDKIRNLQKN